jgi:hypothetical protein
MSNDAKYKKRALIVILCLLTIAFIAYFSFSRFGSEQDDLDINPVLWGKTRVHMSIREVKKLYPSIIKEIERPSSYKYAEIETKYSLPEKYKIAEVEFDVNFNFYDGLLNSVDLVSKSLNASLVDKRWEIYQLFQRKYGNEANPSDSLIREDFLPENNSRTIYDDWEVGPIKIAFMARPPRDVKDNENLSSGLVLVYSLDLFKLFLERKHENQIKEMEKI